MTDIVVAMMNEGEAQACVETIRAGMEGIRAAVLDLHEREGWRALGYASWRECVTAEFGQSKSNLYRLLDAARIEAQISPMGELGIVPERQLRELSRVEEPEERRSIWHEAHDRHGDDLTAAKVREVVDARLGRAMEVLPPPPEEPANERAYRLLEVQAITAMRFSAEEMAAVRRNDREADLRFLLRFDTWLHDVMDALDAGAKVWRVK